MSELHLPLIKNIERFAPLSAKEKEYIAALYKHRRLKKRQFFVQSGEPAKYTCYVLNGALKGSITDKEGVERVIQLAIDDWFITDTESYIKGTPATWDVEAVEDTEILQIDYASEKELIKNCPAYVEFQYLSYERAFIGLQNRVFSIYTNTAEERYEAFAKKYPAMLQRFPQKVIASFLGITPEFLSKLRGKQR